MCIKKSLIGEVIDRMNQLNLHQNVIEEYRDRNQLNMSEAPFGALYWITEEEQKLVDTFEKAYSGTKVYHIIKTYSKYLGTVYDLLYVHNNQENWNLDREKIKDNFVLSHTVTQYPENGYIKVKKTNGGLVRLY